MPSPKGLNPFAPGSPRPRYFAGRQQLIEEHFIRRLVEKWEADNSAPPLVVHGVRGVGKSALLFHLTEMAVERGWLVGVRRKMTHDENLRITIGDAIEQIEAQILAADGPSARVRKAFDRFKQFSVSLGFAGLSFSVGGTRAERAAGLTQDLTRVLVSLGEAIAPEFRVVLFVDELQFLSADGLHAMVSALEEVMAQGVPITMVAAGLPQTQVLCHRAGGFAERFNYQRLDRFTGAETTEAFAGIAAVGSGLFTADALDLGYRLTSGYPEFIHQLGDAVWPRSGNPITADDLARCRTIYEQQRQDGFYRPRFQLATPQEQSFLVAMAEADPDDTGVRRADAVRRLSPPPGNPDRLVEGLTNKGLVFQSRAYGPYEFTIPGFGEYLRGLPGEG
jgi:hypothetical protein